MFMKISLRLLLQSGKWENNTVSKQRFQMTPLYSMTKI
jgi:hypothetical protein